jgi:hypothetical protein
MEFGYFGWALLDFVIFYFAIILIALLCSLFVIVPVKLLLWLISFLHCWLVIEPPGTMDAAEFVLMEIAKRESGSCFRFNSRQLICVMPQRDLYLEVRWDILVRLTIYKQWADQTRTVWKRWLRSGEASEDLITTCIRYVEHLSTKPKDIQIRTILSEERCAFCKQWLDKVCSSIRCFNCSAPYHLECMEMNGGCATFGCASQLAAAATDFAKSIRDKARNQSAWDRPSQIGAKSL